MIYFLYFVAAICVSLFLFNLYYRQKYFVAKFKPGDVLILDQSFNESWQQVSEVYIVIKEVGKHSYRFNFCDEKGVELFGLQEETAAFARVNTVFKQVTAKKRGNLKVVQ